MTAHHIEKYLTWVASVIRHQGWISQASAKKQNLPKEITTAIYTWNLLRHEADMHESELLQKKKCEPTLADFQEAGRAIAWIKSFSIDLSHTATVEKVYLLKLQDLAKNNFVTARNCSWAATMIPMYRKSAGQDPEKVRVAVAEYPKIVTFMREAKETKTGPARIIFRRQITKKLSWTVDDGDGDIQVHRGLLRSDHPNHFYVTDGLPTGTNKLYGTIHPNGQFYPAPGYENTPADVTRVLERVNSDPIGMIREYGKATGVCPLCDRESLGVLRYGYGGECGKRFKLPQYDRGKLARIAYRDQQNDAIASQMPRDLSADAAKGV